MELLISIDKTPWHASVDKTMGSQSRSAVSAGLDMALSSQLDISPAASAPLEREREWGYDPSLRRVGMSPDCHWIANQAAVSSPRSVPRGSLYHDTDQAGPTTRHGNLHTISQQPGPGLVVGTPAPSQDKPSHHRLELWLYLDWQCLQE